MVTCIVSHAPHAFLVAYPKCNEQISGGRPKTSAEISLLTKQSRPKESTIGLFMFICCYSVIYIILNCISLGFELLVGQKFLPLFG